MEINNEINNNINIEKQQNKFINTTLGKVINNALDIGLRYVLPDLIEEEVIDVKNSLMQNGLNAGINTAIDNAINLGKSAVGIVTGNFESVSQIQKAVETGGLIDTLSNVIDFASIKARKAGVINTTVESLIRTGKNTILNNINSNITKELTNQEKNIEKLEKYTLNWKEYFKNKNFSGMQKEYNKIEEKLKEIIPMENTIKEARNIEILHNLIKNNGQNFELSQQEIELASKLS